MRSLLFTKLSKQLRGVSAAACLLAVSMQVTLPVLHGAHIDLPSYAASATDTVRSPDTGAHEHADHEAATCAQCRIVSQLKTLTPPASLLHVPSVSEAWIADALSGPFRSRATLDSAAPRAPPVPA